MLVENDLYQVKRGGKHFTVVLKYPHRVVSTSDVNGGHTDKLRYLTNFQSMEPEDHRERYTEILSLNNEDYHQLVADELELDATRLAIMGTAVNINNTVHMSNSFQDITVDAFVTAGAKGNALRAGDTADWYEGEAGNVAIDQSVVKPVIKDNGTINIILIINRALSGGAQAKTITLLNEAKSAALSELVIGSTRSEHIATGTGTDQYIVAAPVNSSQPPLTSASGHLKFGELVGDVVRRAVLDALRLHNGLERSTTRSVEHALRRFGVHDHLLLEKLKPNLSERDFELLCCNKRGWMTDPKLVANAYAFAAIMDRANYGTLSDHIEPDIFLDHAALTAVAVSGDHDHWASFRAQIDLQIQTRSQAQISVPTGSDYFITALAIGWRAKWSRENRLP